MKKLIFIITIILIGNCTNTQPLDVESNIADNEWVHNNIKYLDRNQDIEIWFVQTPQITLNRRTGICSDMAVLLMKLIYLHTGVKTHYVSSYLDGYYRHAMVYDGNFFYDPVNNDYTRNLNVEYYMVDYDFMIFGDP